MIGPRLVAPRHTALEAMRLVRDNTEAVAKWLGSDSWTVDRVAVDFFYASEEHLVVRHGQWLVRTDDDKVLVLDAATFVELFDPVP